MTPLKTVSAVLALWGLVGTGLALVASVGIWFEPRLDGAWPFRALCSGVFLLAALLMHELGTRWARIYRTGRIYGPGGERE